MDTFSPIPENDELSPLLSKSSFLPVTHHRRSSTLGEYESVGIVVVENEEREAVIMHDLGGPLLPEYNELPFMERRDSIMEDISMVMDEKSVMSEMPPSDVGGKTSMPSLIASMTKCIVGSGALSLCNGIARCANAPVAVITASFWVIFIAIVFGYFCWLIGKICDFTGRTTYRGIWQETVGYKGSVFISIANVLKAAMTDLAYATILTDTLGSLFEAVGMDVSRISCLLIVSIAGILPLCLLKNLSVLAPFSIIGTLGNVFTAWAMAIRYFDGSYLPGGRFYNDIDPSLQPDIGTLNLAWSLHILPFLCMIYEAYVMHYNSARFYTELKRKTLTRFGTTVTVSFGIAAIVCTAICTFGYLTFGGNCAGYILNNYSPHDPLATVSRLAIGLSSLTAYPIVFLGVRDGVMDTFEVPISAQTPRNLNFFTYGLLGTLTIIAMFVTDLGLINAVGGGIVATAIVFVFPTVMLVSASRKSLSEKVASRRQIVLTCILTLIGLSIGIYGASSAIFAKPTE